MAYIEYWADNPKDEDLSPPGSFSKVRIERAPDVSGAAGAFTQLAEVAIDVEHTATLYTDAAGDTLSWYRHRWASSDGLTLSDYSDPIQADDSRVRARAIQDLKDATDITTPMWKDWIAQAVESLYVDGIWYPWRETVTPSTNSDGSAVEYYDLPYSLADAFWMEKVDPTTLRHIAWLSVMTEWLQLGRQVRIYNADTQAKYVVHGKRRYRNTGELGVEFWNLVAEKVREKYLKFRYDQLLHFRKYVFLDKRVEVNPSDIDRAMQRVAGNIASMRAALQQDEPAIPVSIAGYGVG